MTRPFTASQLCDGQSGKAGIGIVVKMCDDWLLSSSCVLASSLSDQTPGGPRVLGVGGMVSVVIAAPVTLYWPLTAAAADLLQPQKDIEDLRLKGSVVSYMKAFF